MILHVIDAFTDQPFSGNPAAVCLLTEAKDVRWYQDVAAEMKHAETAFLMPKKDSYGLRWFTPSAEVDLCGHATLAAAHFLWSQGEIAKELTFDTRSGPLTCRRQGKEIEISLPSTPVEQVAQATAEIAALGLDPLFIGKSKFDWILQLESSDAVKEYTPDFPALAACGMRGLVITAKDDDFDFVSRFFAPTVGVPEDPVTGSAHCALAPFWSERLGKSRMRGYQASERGGVVKMDLVEDRVLLTGSAITTVRGELVV